MDMTPAAPPVSGAAHAHGDYELAILTEIGALVSSTLELRDAFGKVMQIISDKLNMHRGTMVLLDESTAMLYRGTDPLPVAPDEPWGANIACIGDRVIAAAAQFATAEFIRGLGFDVYPVELNEFAKAEGGVTCLSLLVT